MNFHQDVLSPFLDARDSEAWHVRAVEALHLAESSPLGMHMLRLMLADRGRVFQDPRLEVTLGGKTYASPIGVGAGWDKKGRAVRALIKGLGFSSVEVGTVPPYAQPGNPKPRQFVDHNTRAIRDGVVSLNRLGFNSPGMRTVAGNLDHYARDNMNIGVSVGINKLETDPPAAHAHVTAHLHRYASYIALNVSSPNTPGLREQQAKARLTENVKAVQGALKDEGSTLKVFVKVAPELTRPQLDDVIDVATEYGTGIIAANTTSRQDLKAMHGWQGQEGGLSGDNAIYRAMTTAMIAHIYRVTNGEIETIGVGGVNSATAALDKIVAGATFVQAVTAIRGVGTRLPGLVNRGIAEFMDYCKIKSLSEIRGISSRTLR